MRLSLAITVVVVAAVSSTFTTWRLHPSLADPTQVSVSIDPASLTLSATDLPVQQYPAF